MASSNIDRSNVEKTREEMKHSMIAIAMCYTALEALSNDLFNRLTNHDFDSDDYKSKFSKKELTSRWNHLIGLAYQQEHHSHEIRSLPDRISRDLDELAYLRHQIIHYNPKPESAETVRKFSDDSPVSPELELFTSLEAKQSIQTVRELLETFEKITGYEVPKIE